MQLIHNRKASFEYEFLKEFVAGIVLTGSEVKSLRLKRANLQGSFVQINSGEAYLLNAQILAYEFSPQPDYDPKQTRKLLLKKKEIIFLKEASQAKGVSLIPVSFLLEHNKIKLKFAISRGKKLHDKRAKIKQRDLDREARREVKNSY